MIIAWFILLLKDFLIHTRKPTAEQIEFYNYIIKRYKKNITRKNPWRIKFIDLSNKILRQLIEAQKKYNVPFVVYLALRPNHLYINTN